MLISELSQTLTDSLEDLKIIRKIEDTTYDIIEADKNADLNLVTLKNLPIENTWVFRSEIQDIECFTSQNTTVEETILHLKEGRLYAFMIELKSSLTKKNIKGLKNKFSCSLVKLAVYLAGNNHFKELKDTTLYPVGVTMFNDANFLYTTDASDVEYLSIFQKDIFRFSFSAIQNRQYTSTQIKPPALNRMQIPVLFFQNLDWISKPPLLDSNSFEVDFKDLFDFS